MCYLTTLSLNCRSVEWWWILNACGALVEWYGRNLGRYSENNLSHCHYVRHNSQMECLVNIFYPVYGLPIQMAARSKPCVHGPSLARIVGSNPAGDMDLYLLIIDSVVCCLVEVSALGRSPVWRSPPECGVWEAWKMRRPWPTSGCRAKGGGDMKGYYISLFSFPNF